jgi:hypothetical protein
MRDLLLPSPKFVATDISDVKFEIDTDVDWDTRNTDMAITLLLARPSTKYIAGRRNLGMLVTKTAGRCIYEIAVSAAMDGFCAHYGIAMPVLAKALKCGNCNAPTSDLDAVSAGKWQCIHCGSVSIVVGSLDYGRAAGGTGSFRLKIPIQICRTDQVRFHVHDDEVPSFIRIAGHDTRVADVDTNLRVLVGGIRAMDVR